MSEKAKHAINAPTVLDLFCGAGGMSLGFQNAGCEILGGIDKNSHAVRTHHRNFPDCKLMLPAQNIGKVDLLELPIQPGKVDIIIGGPPCQVFSMVGRVKIKSLPNKDIEKDERNFMYKHFIDFLRHYKPVYFVIENVNTLKSNKIFPIFIKELEKGLPYYQRHDYPGYEVEYKVLLASDYGVPQLRKRLFIIGRRKDCNLKLEWPEKNTFSAISVGEAIGDLPEIIPVSMPRGNKISIKQKDVENQYFCGPQSEYQKKMRSQKKEGESVMNHICRSHNEEDLAIFKMLQQGSKYTDLPMELRRYNNEIFVEKYKCLKLNEPSWTLTAHMQKDCLAYVHPTQTRSISVREAARLQSFPDCFVFDAPMTKMFELVGNSVPPLLAEAIAKPIVEQIKAYKASL